MNIKSTLVNEYTVGGSLLLVGFGLFSTRFADVLSYSLTTLTSMIPVIGGATVTVGRVLGIVPATLGLAVLFRMAREVPVVSEATELPIVKTIVKYIDDLNENMTSYIEIVPGQSGSFPLPGNSGTIKTTKWSPGIGNPYTDGLNPKEMAAEELLLCAEHDDYFAACGCGSIKKKTTCSPKQQAWRSCVAESKGDMAKAKQLYSAMGY